MSATPARGSPTERTILILAFLLLFPGFFFYHTLLGTGTTGAFLGGFFSPVSAVFTLPLVYLYLNQIKCDRHRLTRSELYFALYIAYFSAVVAANAANGANMVIVDYHIQAIVFLVNTFILFKMIDFSHREFRLPAMLCLLAMSAIVFAFSVDGVFYLGALGIARDADSLATYQGFSRSYLVTFLAVIAYTRSLPLRFLLYALGAASLFLNTARSEFVALLFAAPIIEFYYAKQKLFFILALVGLWALINMNLDQIVDALPNNRILELLDLSQSTSASARHYLSIHAMETISMYPIFGDYASYAPGYYSHNILSAWVDLGVFGFIYLLAILIFPAIPMVIQESFSARRSNDFVLAITLACITVMLLFTSHYFTDMLISATLGAYSKYSYGRKYVKDRTPDLGPSAPRYPDFREAVPELGRTRP
jgi:hypothetical protein